jgi:hypothetical protein
MVTRATFTPSTGSAGLLSRVPPGHNCSFKQSESPAIANVGQEGTAGYTLGGAAFFDLRLTIDGLIETSPIAG